MLLKRKVIFRIREEFNEDLKRIQFIPEAKGYMLIMVDVILV